MFLVHIQEQDRTFFHQPNSDIGLLDSGDYKIVGSIFIA